MGRNKKVKPFINKKTASTYHIVRRSQRDVGGYYDDETGLPLDVPNEFVLIPTEETLQRQKNVSNEEETKRSHNNSNNNNSSNNQGTHTTSSSWSRAKVELQKAGLVDDYDYDQHLKPITGTGIFLSSNEQGKTVLLSSSSTHYSHGTTERNAPRDMGDDLDDPLDSSQHVPKNTNEHFHGLANVNIHEIDRQLDSIALTPDCLDDDIAHALFDDYGEDEFEELTDDFCFLASQEPILQSQDADEKGEIQMFDFDAHIARLIEKAKREENGGSKVIPEKHIWWQMNEKEFQGLKARRKATFTIEEGDNETEEEAESYNEDEILDWLHDTPGIAPQLNEDEERALCEKFEQTLAEYDSDEVGNLDHECDHIGGDRHVDGDSRLDSVLEEFLQERRDEIFIDGTKSLQENKRSGGTSYKVLSGKKMVRQEEMMNYEDDSGNSVEKPMDKVKDVLAEADLILSYPVTVLPPEDVLIDGKSYFAETKRNPWDCESILSTYSNLDNNPAIIRRSRSRRQNKITARQSSTQPDMLEEREHIQIVLSNKTGLPLVHRNEAPRMFGEEDDTHFSVNRGEARKKNESKEDKLLRKEGAKAQKRESRLRKKMMKEAVQNEFNLRTNVVAADHGTGISIFRYT